MEMECYRQGDICFEKLDKFPEGVIEKDTMLEIRGEREGHVHRMTGVQILVPPEQEEQLPALVVVSSMAIMVHEEHRPLALPEGMYRVTQFQEYQNPKRVD